MLSSRVCARHCSTKAKKALNGYVLGVFESSNKSDDTSTPVLTATASKVNTAVDNAVHDYLALTKPLKSGGARLLARQHDANYPMISLVGLGKKGQGVDAQEQWDADKHAVRNAVAAGVQSLKSIGATNIMVDSCLHAEAAAEGAVLSTFEYTDQKQKKPESNGAAVDLQLLNLSDNNMSNSKLWQRGVVYGQSQNFARKLATMPPNLLTPTKFGEIVQDKFDKFANVDVNVRDRSWCEANGMNAFLSVSNGSSEPPKFLEIRIRSNSVKEDNKQPMVLIGKGVTFDSGGISIKPSANMWNMRADMAGAAAVCATAWGFASLLQDGGAKHKQQRDVFILCPLTENMPGNKATRPGDIVKAMNGKSIEIFNTDAEGRLILADALCYADTLKPHVVVQVATLTGACMIALGGAAAALFTNNDNLYNQLLKASIRTGDRVWRMPLWQHYRSYMKSDAADINNLGKTAYGGGACSAAAFVKEFTECQSFAHIDMASVMQADDQIAYLKTGTMSGRPTRLLMEYLRTTNLEQTS